MGRISTTGSSKTAGSDRLDPDIGEEELMESLDLELKQEVDEAVEEWFGGENGQRDINREIEQRSEDVLASAEAKRIRPQVENKMLKALGVDLGGEEVQLHLGVEGIHSYSIILDDVEDSDESRRGEQTVHAALKDYTGDGRLSDWLTTNQTVRINTRAYRPIDEMESLSSGEKLEVLEILWDAEEKLGKGQNLDLYSAKLAEPPRDGLFNPDVEEKLSYPGEEFDYLEFSEEVNDLKTASLFEASAEIAAYLGGANEEETGEMKSFANKMARAFQIRDNTLDFTQEEGEIGKDRYSDFQEGVLTPQVYYAVKFLDSHPNEMFSERAEYILDVLAEEEPGDEEIERAADLVSYTPALDAAQNVCTRLVEEAHDHLDRVDWENDEYVDELKDLSVYGGLARGN